LVQTQITFDNERLSLTASTTDTTTPATGESDAGMVIKESANNGFADVFEVSPDSGTNFGVCIGVTATNVVRSHNDPYGIGNSTGRYRLVMTADVDTRVYVQAITTRAEE